MARNVVPAGDCRHCTEPTLACSHNHFQSDDLIIDTWEHKCSNCGFRETIAFRSDDESWDSDAATRETCPYCRRTVHG